MTGAFLFSLITSACMRYDSCTLSLIASSAWQGEDPGPQLQTASR